jgi:hypothetical protein
MSDVDTRPDAAETAPESTETDETGSPGVTAPDESADTFPRSYVEELRKESADHRTKAKAAEERADQLAKRLHAELVKASNRLENPADLPYDAEHLDDADKLSAALDALLADRPYMAKRVVKGDAGQGNRGGNKAAPSWGDLFNGA